jgi:large subunit ribosomal protein L3
MSGLIGKKLGMTTIFGRNGEAIPCTVLEVGPCYVVQVKTREKDGYEALQLGFELKKAKHTTKPLQGHFKKAETPFLRVLREFKGFDISKYKPGDQIRVEDIFSVGDMVKVTGRSKGKGFQGVVKRHGFGGGPKTHGQSDRHRAPGSVGASSFPSRTFKGQRMAGHMGDEKVTVRNLEVLEVIPDSNLLVVKGSVPGARNGYVTVVKLS